MDYKTAVDELVASIPKESTDTDTLAKKVNSIVGELITAQGTKKTQSYLEFFLTHNAKPEDRMAAIFKHLDRYMTPVTTSRGDAGVLCGFRARDNSIETIDYLFIGIPHLYGICIITRIDNDTGTGVCHTCVGAFLTTDFRTIEGCKPLEKVVIVSTPLRVNAALVVLQKLGNDEDPEEVKVDESKTMAANIKEYEKKWGKD